MANRVRGETEITLGGRKFAVFLGLRTLAELEDEFQTDSFEEVLGRLFQRASARNMLKFLEAVLRGNGINPDEPSTRESLDAMSPIDFARVAQQLFDRSGLADPVEDADKAGGADRPLAVPNGGGSG